MSSPDKISACVRKLSRMVRLTLFLVTAVFTAFLEIARPIRAYFLPFLRARTTNCESLERQDVLKTLLKSAALLSLCFRGKRLKRTGASCLWLCATSGSAARLWCACERENHGGVSALYCWAGTCVSLAICAVSENHGHFTFLSSGLSIRAGDPGPVFFCFRVVDKSVQGVYTWRSVPIFVPMRALFTDVSLENMP